MYNTSRLDTDEERIVELKDKPEENFQSEAWRENKKFRKQGEDIVTRQKIQWQDPMLELSELKLEPSKEKSREKMEEKQSWLTEL